jgi:hypothetical protein
MVSEELDMGHNLYKLSLMRFEVYQRVSRRRGEEAGKIPRAVLEVTAFNLSTSLANASHVDATLCRRPPELIKVGIGLFESRPSFQDGIIPDAHSGGCATLLVFTCAKSSTPRRECRSRRDCTPNRRSSACGHAFRLHWQRGNPRISL